MDERPTTPDDSSGAKFLAALDALVLADGRAPGFEGSIALGVREEAGDVWWLARAASEVETAFSQHEPEATDVSVLLGARELASYMKTGRFPPDATTVVCRGDLHLFQRVLERYATTATALDVRGSSENVDAARRRRRKRRLGKGKGSTK